MSFVSVNYIVFLPVVAAGYFVCPKKFKNIFLLLVSYYFYFCTEARFFLVLPALTLVTYAGGKAISRRERKGPVLALTAGANLGVLCFFKYTGFFIPLLERVLGIEFSLSRWILPRGLSFYVFMAISYLADIALGKSRPRDSFVDFAVYLSFFPHVLMGPIDKADKFLPQLKKEHRFEYGRCRTALQLMAIGYFKKIAVADVLAMFVNRVHGEIYSYSGFTLLFTAVIYSFQLYADFSGYSDIARGSRLFLGFDLRENFDTPYLSTSFSQFWSRWHISLSGWFQDYIFTPLVWTNPLRKLPLVGRFFQSPPVIPAVAAVFIASGIWHGNTLNFLVWGMCHGIYRICEELLRKYWKKPDRHPGKLKFRAKVVWVFSLVTFSQIFFRCADMPSAFYCIRQIFANPDIRAFPSQFVMAVGKGFDFTPLLIARYTAFCMLALAVLVISDFIRRFRLGGRCLTEWLDGLHKIPRWLCYYFLLALIMAGFIMNNGGFGSAVSFIYNGF